MVRGNRWMKIWLLIAAPFLVMALAVGTALQWDFNDPSGAREMALAAMSLERVAGPLKKIELRISKKGPFRAQVEPFMAGKGAGGKYGHEDINVGLIVISEKKSIAMVNGMVLQAGDEIKGLRVKRIEKDRVLFAGKKNFWKYLENRK